jgi:long-chain acyl-CoA synthetase
VTENFASLLDAVAGRRPEAPALVWDGGTLSWRQLERRAGGVARRLARHGVHAGDTIAVVLGNGWGFAAALWGGLKLGATVAPLNPLLSSRERDSLLDHLRPATVLDDVAGEEAAAETADAVAPALVLYTSGSTGRPKGAVLSHAALRFASESWAGPVMRLTPDDVVLAALPLAHSFGLNGALLAPLFAGATVALCERFAAEETLAAMARHRVTVLPAVATMFQKMLEVPALSETSHVTLRLALSGAAPCPWELAEAWWRRTRVRILRGFGMTELFRPISYLADDAADVPEAIGRAVPGVELRIVEDGGEACGPGEAGELWVRTPAAMDGYLRADEETRAVMRDGWFRTGDLARIAPDGLVTIVGRKKELILRGGYSVVPGEVEAALCAHAAVAEAAVIGVPDAALGEEVVAFVVLREGTRPSDDELVSFCRGRLAAFKYPRRICVVSELPKGATGKVLKWQLASRAERVTGL